MSKFSKLLFGFSVALNANVHAQSVLTFDFPGINTAIPDGLSTGLVDAQTISSAPNLSVSDLNVTLSISGTQFGGFNGDLYVSLQHDSGFSVLLNRIGRRGGSSAGYSDSGLNITLDDQASGDVHNYRFLLNGNQTTPLSGPLTGPWLPDGRNVDPASVLDTSGRAATLASFNDLPVNGLWTLFVTDLSSGATQQVNSWSMQMTVTPVPEPAIWSTLAALGLATFAFFRKRES